MQNDDDKLIKKMAKLLREGATMLDKSCPNCGTLIYRLPNKKIICPSCNSEIIIQKDSSASKNVSQLPNSMSKISHDFQPVLNNLYLKLGELNHALQDESDFAKIESILTMIDKILQIYKKIHDLYLPTSIGSNNAKI